MNHAPACILIVDDEPQNRRLLEALLRPEGYQTISAGSGAEALAAITRRPPDLILLDVMMPDIDGHELARQLKDNPATANIPIILVTAQTDREARLAGLNAGAEEFLCKPVDRAELWLRVRNLLRLKAYGDFLQGNSFSLQQAMEAQESSLQRFHSAMDATADAIVLIERASMRVVQVNATATKLFGYERAELLEMPPTSLFGGSMEMLQQSFDALITGGTLAPQAQVRRKDGSFLPVETHRHVSRSGADWIVVVVVRDITERTITEQRLHQLAHFDPLTELPNRTQFHQTLRNTIAQVAGTDWQIVVMFIDLDHFKNVNDSLGHAFGDELLVKVSKRLLECVRMRDTVARLGGDEFALIMVMRDAQAGATIVAAKMQAALARPFHLQGHEVAVSASIGITLHPIDAPDPETLLKYADTAMYRAKQAGRDAVRFFTPQMNAELLARRELEAALRRAIDNGEFELHYQPKVLLATGRVAGVEALLRWRRPDQGMVSPAEFIPALEESGLIVRVGHWVVDTACRQIGEWLRSGIGPLQVSVNVSGRQFIEGDLEGVVLQALAQHRVPAGLLELELTESSLMANTERTVAMLGTLRGHGVEVSIDDFGTGYSSLAYLRRFPVDKLKIDIAFIRHLTESADDAAIVLAIIRMAHSLKLQVIAEGVETAAQLAYLRHHRCDQIQGYHFSRPLPLAELEALMASGKHLPAPPGFRSGAGKTLLIVDDDPDNLEELTILFQPEGYRLLHARTPAEGFDLLAQNAVQVILCDRYMPQMDGIEFLGRANELYPATVRILLSGSVDLESIVAAINRGEVFRFYAKPWHPPTLLQNVHEAFRQYWQQHDDGQEKREPVSADG